VAGEESAADLDGKTVDFFMLEILNEDFFGDGVAPGDGTNDFAGFGFLDISAGDDQEEIDIPFKDFDEEDFILQNGVTYFGYLSMPERLLMGYDNQYINHPLSLTEDQVIFTSRLFFDGSFQSTFGSAMPYIKLNLLTTTIDNTPL